MKKIYCCFVFLLLLATGNAQWDGNPATVNNPVTTAPTDDTYHHIVSDGAGGVIVVWAGSEQASTRVGIYAQHKTSAGNLTWGGGAAAPVKLFTVDASNGYVLSISELKADGSGGAYISWNVMVGDTTATLYLQHLNSLGAETFTPGGMNIVPNQGMYITDGKLCITNGGVIIAWSEQVQDIDSVLPSYAQVLLQRYNVQGQPQWGSSVPVSTVPSFRGIGELVSDGSNGAFIAFVDTRNSHFDTAGNSDNLDIYAQHISSTGSRLWGTQDALVSNAPYNQLTLEGGGGQVFSSMIADSAGGFILVYEDYRNDNDSVAKLYAQRLNSSGTRLWAANGVALYSAAAAATASTNLTAVVNDGANGMVASWDATDFVETSANMYAQRITGAGAAAWGADGVVVNAAGTNYGYETSTLAADGTGSYVAAWVNTADAVIKGQKLNGSGEYQWTADGVNICTNPLSFGHNPSLIKSTGNSMIAVWMDRRNSASNQGDLYAAKIGGTGNLVNTAVYTSVANGNWNNPATWQGNAVPSAGADVIIQTVVIANADAVCNTLTVQAPGSLTVNTGIHITVIH